MEIRKDDQVTYHVGLSLAAAINHTKEVVGKHSDWSPAQRLGSFLTSLRRMLASIRPAEGSVAQEKLHNSLELRLLNVDNWALPGVMKPHALKFSKGYLSPEVDLEVAFRIAETWVQDDDFSMVSKTLTRLENGIRSLTFCSEHLNIANDEADEIVTQMGLVLDAYPELTNG